MQFQLTKVKPALTDPDNAYTAQFWCDGSHKLNVTKIPEKAWPDLAYAPKAETPEACFESAQAEAVRLGFAHLHAFIAHLYATRNEVNAQQKQQKQAEEDLRKLCSEALVFRLPRHKEGEYEVSKEAPKNGKKKGLINSPEHRAYITKVYADFGVEVVEFLNDRYTTQLTLV